MLSLPATISPPSASSRCRGGCWRSAWTYASRLLVLRDLDLLKEINQRAPSVVFLSLISSPDSPSYERVRKRKTWRP